MKIQNFVLGLVLALSFSFAAEAASYGPRQKFQQVVYLKYGGAATNNGFSPENPKPFADGDLWPIPAGVVIEKVYFLNDTAITGTTVMEVGDDDDADGFCTDAVLAGGFATPGMYGYSAKDAGAYLRTQTAGVTDAADIYVVPNAKYYSATGKEVKLNITTANTAGKGRVVIEGFYHGGYAP